MLLIFNPIIQKWKRFPKILKIIKPLMISVTKSTRKTETVVQTTPILPQSGFSMMCHSASQLAVHAH